MSALVHFFKIIDPHIHKLSCVYGTVEHTKQYLIHLETFAYWKTVVYLLNIGLCQIFVTGLTIELQWLSNFDPYLPEHWPMPGWTGCCQSISNTTWCLCSGRPVASTYVKTMCESGPTRSRGGNGASQASSKRVAQRTRYIFWCWINRIKTGTEVHLSYVRTRKQLVWERLFSQLARTTWGVYFRWHECTAAQSCLLTYIQVFYQLLRQKLW